MYPSAPHNQGAYTPEAHGGPVPASGVPHTPPTQAYAAGYIARNTPFKAPAVGMPWSTGLCHCCDDPANCKNTKPLSHVKIFSADLISLVLLSN
uniref:Uncharacterized protein n=1 Tax=Nelumbo nucifera TaxID=4432 RepID=A0A822Z9I8_NELNU|nr:TPA_asm: hypothetical protein HUJ06_015573 [Nelumbo nucifera]